MIERAKEILQSEIETLQNLPLDEYLLKQVIDLFVNCQGKIIFTGMGKAGKIADKIAATLSSTGTPSVFMHPGEAAHGDLGLIKNKEDIIVALSNSGKTQEVILTLELCKDAFPDCKIIGICSSKRSEMAALCDIVLELGSIKEAGNFALVPTCSTIAMLALGDIISILTMEHKKFSLVRYSQLHHGGYLKTLINNSIKKNESD